MKNNYTKTSLLLCIIVLFVTSVIYYPKWDKQHTEATISWDVSGYYLYLPAVFIYKDLAKLDFMPEILKKYRPTPDFQQAYKYNNENYVLKYSCGQAVMYSPFFFIAHIIALMRWFIKYGHKNKSNFESYGNIK